MCEYIGFTFSEIEYFLSRASQKHDRPKVSVTKSLCLELPTTCKKPFVDILSQYLERLKKHESVCLLFVVILSDNSKNTQN